MNIFVTDPSPTVSAQVLPDKHIVKMPLESCQMLAIVCSERWGHGYGEIHKKDGEPYKTDKGAFRGHPCTVWANESNINAWWLVAHAMALCEEYTHRYGKVIVVKTLSSKQDTLFHLHWKDQKNSHLQDPMSLNMTQALTLLLLTNVIYRPNLGLHLIIYVTHPDNQIGYERI